MENINLNGYGLWSLVFINSFIFILFAYSFTKLKTRRDWPSFILFSAFVLAHFTEMYGFPLTMYWFSGWLPKLYPSINLFSHTNGHLFHTLLGFKGDPHFGFFHAASLLFVFFGLGTVAYAWGILSEAQKKNELATSGPYFFVRHPQYLGFMLIMFGFIIQWPTLITLILFPALVIVYVRLSSREEKEMLQKFGKKYTKYAKDTPMFIPRFSKF
ncbi:MAG: isoprenylcysteine carboxylmethyltransferase family protein [Alphaproteobacteria bacterium]|nr:isoprenylcysteine carboxylmethyltransferase family protein [Alphaproteobacteria bacterium]